MQPTSADLRAEARDALADYLDDSVVVNRRELSLLVCCATSFALGIGQREDPDPDAADEIWEAVIRNGRRVGYTITRGGPMPDAMDWSPE